MALPSPFPRRRANGGNSGCSLAAEQDGAAPLYLFLEKIQVITNRHRSIVRGMSEVIERDTKTGRFLAGNSGNGGRRPGARSKLTTAFLDDLKTVWAEAGIDALRRSAREDATGFVRIVAGLMPKTLDLTVDATETAVGFAEAFRQALSMLHGEQQPRVIEHDHRR